MVLLGIYAIAFIALAGLLVKKVLEVRREEYTITWKEFAIGMGLISVVIVPLTMKFGEKIARGNNLRFQQYLNGWEAAATVEVTQCTKDGPCWYEYDCEPYRVRHESCTGTGSDRKCTTYYTTEYHDCPYVEKETNYVVATTLKDFTIAEHRLPDNPEEYRWKGTRDYKTTLPDYVTTKAGVGAPKFWIEAKNRIEAGKPDPVTLRDSYDNYILASEKTILAQYSGAIAEYKKAGLLPNLESGVHEFYYANKVSMVGFKTVREADWQKDLGFLNASLGTELQGDLRLVVVQSEDVSKNPDAYTLALKAYWQDSKEFGKEALSKNALVVVVGTEDGTTLTWSRAFSGMPLGNEYLLTRLRDELRGSTLEPETFLGKTGKLRTILWGSDDPKSKFERVSMTGHAGGRGGGFQYLENEIQLKSSQKAVILFVAFLAGLVVWLGAAFYGRRDYY